MSGPSETGEWLDTASGEVVSSQPVEGVQLAAPNSGTGGEVRGGDLSTSELAEHMNNRFRRNEGSGPKRTVTDETSRKGNRA